MDIDINHDADLLKIEIENQTRELEEIYNFQKEQPQPGPKRCMKPFCADFKPFEKASQEFIDSFDKKFEAYKKEAE